jgi:hypothetical protein
VQAGDGRKTVKICKKMIVLELLNLFLTFSGRKKYRAPLKTSVFRGVP